MNLKQQSEESDAKFVKKGLFSSNTQQEDTKPGEQKASSNFLNDKDVDNKNKGLFSKKLEGFSKKSSFFEKKQTNEDKKSESLFSSKPQEKDGLFKNEKSNRSPLFDSFVKSSDSLKQQSQLKSNTNLMKQDMQAQEEEKCFKYSSKQEPKLSKEFSFSPQSFKNQEGQPSIFYESNKEKEQLKKTNLFDWKSSQEEKYELPKGQGVIGLSSDYQQQNAQNEQKNIEMFPRIQFQRQRGKSSTNLFGKQSTVGNSFTSNRLFSKNLQQEQQNLLQTKKLRQQKSFREERQAKLYKSAMNHPFTLFTPNSSQIQQNYPAATEKKDFFNQMTINDILNIIPSLDKKVEIKFRKLGLHLKQREAEFYRKESKYQQILGQFQKINQAKKNLRQRVLKISELIEQALLKNVKYQEKLKILIAEQKLRQGSDNSQSFDTFQYCYQPAIESKSESRVKNLIEKAINICKTTDMIKANINQFQLNLSNSSQSSSSLIGLMKEKQEAYLVLQRAQDKMVSLQIVGFNKLQIGWFVKVSQRFLR